MNRLNLRSIGYFAILVSSLQFSVSGAFAQCGGTWVQRMPAISPSPRANPGMAYDSVRHVTVLFGGYTGFENGDTWEWDGTNWSQKAPGTSPSARELFGMAYDSKRGVTVLYGGETAVGDSNETWEWNGTNWALRTSTTAPPARNSHVMAYDSNRGVCVIFGGNANGMNVTDTWEWDGTNWSIKTPATNPGTATEIPMAFDSIRGVCVLQYGDTWEWDGTNWSSHSPATAPVIRYGGAESFDSWRGVTVLFSGFSIGVGGLDDTWEWDGTSWTQRMPLMPPTMRVGHAMAFDSARGVTLMFGGNSGGNLNETWEWTGPGAGISQQPTDQTVAADGFAAFSVVAVGGGTLTFHWRRNGFLVADGGEVSGATTATLTINPVAAADNGVYDCQVSNSCGTIISRAAVLSIDPCKTTGSTGDCNANGILDSCEIAADASLDANGNGVLDACETPQSPASCGTCGAGTTMMTGLTAALVFAFMTARRKSRSGTNRK